MDRSRLDSIARWSVVSAAALVACAALLAQGGGGGQGKGGGKGAVKGPPATPKVSAPIDLTGTWVALVTEDWLSRMVTPPKGDADTLATVPVSPAGRAAANSWDPAKDEAAGNQCLAYGPPGLTRQPGRIQISWADDNTLKADFDAGTQTRLLKFGPPMPGAPSRMGYSVASWEGMGRGGRGAFGVPAGVTGDPNAGQATATVIRPGSLRVITTGMTPGYLHKNGVPYSAQTTLSEWWDIIHEPDGTQYLVISSVVEDPVNLQQPWRTSTHFKKEASNAKFSPSACTVR